jgi:hypothetical protein
MSDPEILCPEGMDCTDALVITVRHQDMRLELGGPTIARLQPGQSVVWQFEDIPPGWIPYVLLVEGVEDPFGPFEAIHQTADKVIATGNDGRVGRFAYFAVLRNSRRPRMNVLVSLPGELIQGAEAVIEVVVDLEVGQFLIEPQEVHIEPGQSVFWRFPNLDPEYLPEICFYRMVESGAEDTEPGEVGHFGPFETLSRMPGGIMGSGRGAAETGRFAYYVDVTSVDLSQGHQTLESYNSEDPFVDTDPPPPPEPGTL